MRKLQTSDLFAAMRAIKRAGLKENIKPVVELAATGKVRVEDIGIEAMLTILEAFAEKGAEESIYEFLSGPFEIPADEIRGMELAELAKALGELAKESDLKGFFSVLSVSIGRTR